MLDYTYTFTWINTGEQQNYGFIYASSVFVSYKFHHEEPTSARAKFRRGVRKVDPNLAGSKVLFDFVVLKDFLLIVKYCLLIVKYCFSLWNTTFSLWNTLSSHRERVSFHAEVHCLLIVKFCYQHERFSFHWEIRCLLIVKYCLLIVNYCLLILRGFLFMEKYTVFWLWRTVFSSWKVFFSLRNTLSSPYNRLSSNCLGKPQNIGKLLGKACLQGRLGSCGLSFAREVPPLLFQSHFTFLHSRLQNKLDSHAHPATLSSLPSCVIDASVSRTEYSLSRLLPWSPRLGTARGQRISVIDFSTSIKVDYWILIVTGRRLWILIYCTSVSEVVLEQRWRIDWQMSTAIEITSHIASVLYFGSWKSLTKYEVLTTYF